MKRRFDPAVLEMMDRPATGFTGVGANLERIRQLIAGLAVSPCFALYNRWIKTWCPHAHVIDLATGSGDIRD